MENRLAVETRERQQSDNSTKGAFPAQAMTGGQALVAALIENDIDTIFALPGVQLDGAFDALYDQTDKIRVIHPRHEQAAAYMADGYARNYLLPRGLAEVATPGIITEFRRREEERVGSQPAGEDRDDRVELPCRCG